MKPTACGLILFIYAYSLSFSAAASYGEACTDDSNCTDTGQVCTKNPADNTCTCYTDNNYKYDGSKCVKELGTDCSDTAACNNANVICDGSKKCKCNTLTHYDNNGETTPAGSCIAKHALGIDCTNPGIAVNSEQCLTGNAACIALSGTSMYTCQCKNGYYQVGTGCVQERYLDQSCNSNSGCKNTNSECRNNQCLCKSGYYQTDTGTLGTCTRQALGEACSDSHQCSTSYAVCSSGGNRKCECSYGYYDSNGVGSGGSCELKVLVGGDCPRPTGSVPNTATCFGSNARCMSSGNSYTCQCISTYYDNQISNNRQCLRRKRLGDACNTPVNNFYQCSDSSASCRLDNSVYKCKCNSGYHQEQTQCIGNALLGDPCNVTAIKIGCSDPFAICLDNKCTCNTLSYDSNGLSNDGTCMPILNLMVTNVSFSSIQNNKITVTWTTPQNYRQYINSFKVTWKATDDNNVITESENLDSTKTSYTLTREIDPGRVYIVTIISFNDQTQQGSQRTSSIVRNQAARPGKTSGIDESNSDKDVSDGTITLAWFDVPGYKSSYIVTLKDGENVLLTKTVGSESATFSSSVLKNGYDYTVTIQAKSEVFDNGKTELGEIFTAIFRTFSEVRNLDERCNTDSQCATDNTECANYTCTCKTGYYKTGTGSLGTCTKQQLGEACSETTQCSTRNTECRSSSSRNSSSTFRICQCLHGYYDTNVYEFGRSCRLVAMSSTCECTTSTQSLIVGVVLGLIIILLLVYAGYATFLIRRYRAKDGQKLNPSRRNDHKSQTYENETFTMDVANLHSTKFNAGATVEPTKLFDNIYTRLDDKTMEDKSTYDIIRPRQ